MKNCFRLAVGAGALFLAATAHAQTPQATASPPDKVTVTGADTNRFSFYFRTKEDAVSDLYRRLHAACAMFDKSGVMLLDEQRRARPVNYHDQEKSGAACAEILFTHLVGKPEAIKAGFTNAGVKIDSLIPFWVVGFEYPANNRMADVKVYFRQAHGDGRRYVRTIDELVEAVDVKTSSNGSARSSIGPVESKGAFNTFEHPYYGVVWPDLCDALKAHAGYCGDFAKAHLRWNKVIDEADRKRAGSFDPQYFASGRME